MAIYYIGAFPPVYGGVTIKNQNLYEALDSQLDLRRIDMNRIKRGDVREMLRFGWAMLTGKQYIIGLAGQKNRRDFTKLLYALKRKAMGRSVMLVMGGVVEDILQAGPEYVKKLGTFRRVYLEYPGMAGKLTAEGLRNAAVYPNGRPRPDHLPPITQRHGALRCVFFSLIQPEKGVDRILEAAGKLPEIEFHFYGRIVPEYREAFEEAVEAIPNVHYHGLFAGDSDAVYRELNQYDVLLLPTRCKTEGLPGILIEAKIAGLTSVISGINYTGETVTNGIDGIVLPEDTPECLVSALQTIDGDREKLLSMKQASRASAEQYYIDVCAAAVVKDLKREEIQ